MVDPLPVFGWLSWSTAIVVGLLLGALVIALVEWWNRRTLARLLEEIGEGHHGDDGSAGGPAESAGDPGAG